ncbi:MAG: hypothetical protein DRP83_05835 [Planctomycetota bacterium]|nr:MAG: hypothetical protein DRP83_05835 [Planctomycetota bacterium]
MMMTTSKGIKRPGQSASSRGFTLAEVLVAAVILGIGFTAILASMASSTSVNAAGGEITQAVFLAQGVREWTANLPFRDPDAADADNPPGPDSYVGSDPYVDDLDDLLSATFSPPRNSFGQPITSLAGWSQTTSLTWRDEGDPNAVVANGASDVIYVQVTISHDGSVVLNTGWLITDERSEE